MKKFTCNFKGVLIGALGKSYANHETVIATDKDSARDVLYTKYEHLSKVSIIECEKGDYRIVKAEAASNVYINYTFNGYYLSDVFNVATAPSELIKDSAIRKDVMQQAQSLADNTSKWGF